MKARYLPSESLRDQSKKQNAFSRYALNVLVSLGSILFLLFVIEVTTRIMDGDYAFKNRLQQADTLFEAAYPVQYDSDLGWIPKPGTSGKTNIWRTTVTILDDGIRSNGTPSFSFQGDAVLPILAVGDSFTFGDQVSDHETWPAILESLSGNRVFNAGVFGYGVDQIFLRAQQLIEKYHPQALIFSFIPGDIYRCELSEQMGAGKPYFEISHETLVLKNIPVPPPAYHTVSTIRQVLSYSCFIHKTMMKLAPYYWLRGIQLLTPVHSEGEQVTCRIFRELGTIAQMTRIPVYLLVQYDDNQPLVDLQMTDRILRCVNQDLLHVIDLRTALSEEKSRNSTQYRSYFNGHMTYAGNYFVASKLKATMYP